MKATDHSKPSRSGSFLSRNYRLLLTREASRYVFLACAFLAFVLVCVDRSVTAQLERNGAVAYFLSIELKHESATNLRQARDEQATLLRTTIQRLESPTIRFVGSLDHDLSPTRRLTPALEVLANAATPHREALNHASEILASAGSVWSHGEKISASIRTPDSRRRLEAAESLTSEFIAELVSFEHAPNVSAADSVCQKSRLASAAFITAWVDSSWATRGGKAKQLEDALRRLEQSMEQLTKKSTTAPEDAERLAHYAVNIGSRALVFHDMRTGGLQAGRNRLLAMLQK